MRTPKVIPILKSTADADGTIAGIAAASGVKLSRFADGISLAVFVSAPAPGIQAPYDITIQPTAGPQAIPAPAGPGSWKNVSHTRRLQGMVDDSGIGGGAIEMAVSEFGDNRYGAFTISGTIPATAEVMLAIIGWEKKADHDAQPTPFEFPAGSTFTPRGGGD